MQIASRLSFYLKIKKKQTIESNDRHDSTKLIKNCDWINKLKKRMYKYCTCEKYLSLFLSFSLRNAFVYSVISFDVSSIYKKKKIPSRLIANFISSLPTFHRFSAIWFYFLLGRIFILRYFFRIILSFFFFRCQSANRTQ